MRFRKYITEKKIQMTGDELKDYFIKQINKWDEDLFRMTKAYKSLKAPQKQEFFEKKPDGSYGFIKNIEKHPVMKRFKEYKKYFITFKNNFENWIYNKVLDPKTFGGKNESPWQSDVRKTAWDFLYSIDTYRLFPYEYSIELDKEIDAPWLLDVKYRGNQRKTNILRYQRLWRKFKESIEDMINYEIEKLNKTTEDEKIQISGVNILIKNKPDDKKSDKYIKNTIDHLRRAISIIKKEGLSKAMKGFRIEYNFNPSTVQGLPMKGALVSGAYDKGKDIVYLFPLSRDKITDSTLIHEIGHRYWFRYVPEKAKKEWTLKILKNTIEITNEHIDKFFDKFYSEEDLGFPYRKEMKKEVKKMEDSELKIVFTYLADNTPIFQPEEGKNRYEVYKDFMIKRAKGENIPIEFITDYGRTNPSEAFAEAFKLWVGGQKGKLGPWTKAFFKDIVVSGGANIKEEKLLEKYLTCA